MAGYSTRLRIRFLTTLALLSAPPASAQPGATWRFWDSADWSAESYTSSVAISPEGVVWVKHGSTGPGERLDGYFAPHFPDPGKTGQLAAAPAGAVWMWAGTDLKRFLDGSWSGWTVPQVSAFGEQHNNYHLSWEIVSRGSPPEKGTVQVVGLDNTHALILLPDRILEFDAARGLASTVLVPDQAGLSRFIAFSRARDGSVIVSGRGGWGRMISNHGTGWSWKPLPRPPSPYIEFDAPLETPAVDKSGGSLLLTGITANHEVEALRFDGRAWTSLYRGESSEVRAFPGPDGAIWIRDGNNLIAIAGQQRYRVEKRSVLSGVLLDAAADGTGNIWIASSQGLSRAAPSLWRAPPGAPDIDDVVNSIVEDRRGNIWFLAANSLIRYDNSAWKSWPLPRGDTAWAVFANGLQFLPDGRIAIRVTAEHLLVFDPEREQFRAVPYPASRVARMIAAGPGGKVLVETIDPAAKTTYLSLFDGNTFQPFGDPAQIGRTNELRYIEFVPDGGMYVGGIDSFGISKGGAYHRIGASEGFTDPGAFSIHRSTDGRVFAGGRDSFFELLNGKWRRLQTGLDRVRRIALGRDGTVWLATGTGVQRYQRGVWFSNGEEEGLPSSVAYSVFEDSRGRVWAGTTRGLSLFHPDADLDPPIVRLDDERNPREAPPGGKVTLAYSGIDKWKFTSASRLLFSSRMDSGAWSPFGSRSAASFMGLSPGPHRFEVRAMDRNGNVSPNPAVHGFTMLVPWYDTTGFRFLASVAGLLIAFFSTIALMSYRQRGRLIQALNQKNKLERDRQKILQMTASHQTLGRILSAIASSAAGNSPGATCLLIADGVGYCFPPLSGKLSEAVRAIATEPCTLGEWRARIGSATHPLFAPDFLLVPVSQSEQTVSNVIALLSPTRRPATDSADSTLETFANLASGAIENNRLYQQLAYQARHDVLTGLPNRASFEEELGALVESSGPGDIFAVLYLDLDRFKQINDTLGHRVGDLFLQQVSLRLSGALQGQGKLFRIGGDEFIVLAPARRGGQDSIEQIASALLSFLKAPIRIAGAELFASASIGVSFFPQDGESPTVLQKNADVAMYRAKARGRNGYELFTPEMAGNTGVVPRLEQILRHAVAEERFRLCYQPRFTPSGRPAGFEAMLRLVYAGRELIEAAEFIPLAEQSGLIVPIGQWVVREVCRQLNEWRSEGLPETCISFNVSPHEVSRPSYAAGVAATLAEAGVPGRMIQIELTETVAISNLPECLRQIDGLRSLGIRLALDEFGTGNSSLSWLQNMPVDMLKIQYQPPLLQAVVAMGRSLGIALSIVGIETPEQLSIARSLLQEDSDFIQGNLLKPASLAADVKAYLAPAISGFGYFVTPEPQTDSSVSMAAEHCEALTS